MVIVERKVYGNREILYGIGRDSTLYVWDKEIGEPVSPFFWHEAAIQVIPFPN